MKVLVIADVESKSLWDYYSPKKLEGVDLIISCGDLNSNFLQFLVTLSGRPLLYDPEHFYEDPLLQGGNVKEIWDETTQGVDRILADHGYTRDGGIWTCADNRDDVLMLFCHFGIGMAVAAYLTSTSPFLLWHTTSMAPSSVTTLITEERVKGEVWFRCVQMGDISHLWAENEPYSTAGLFAEVYDGRDSTEPASWGSRA